MAAINYDIIESGLNALLDGMRDFDCPKHLEREIVEAIEGARYGKIESEAELCKILKAIIIQSRPRIVSAEWIEAWSNLFSQLIKIIQSSDQASEEIISHLYGYGELPDEAGNERVLCINPGSTSTKLALYRGLMLESSEEVHLPPDYQDSIDARADEIIRWLKKKGLSHGELTGICCRGGFIKPVRTGTYKVCGEMLRDLEKPRIDHASNMGIPIGMRLAERFASSGDTLVTTTHPVSSDEIETTSRLTGIRKIIRDGSGAHYLNHEAVHCLVSSLLDRSERKLTTVSAHIGGGISVMRHTDGDVVDLVNAFAGVPSANRCGNVPLDRLLEAIDQSRTNFHEIKKYVFGNGGLIDLVGTNDFRALLHFRDSAAMEYQRNKINIVIDFMARNIAGAIMKLAASPEKVDLSMLTGGLSRSSEFVQLIRGRVFPYFPVVTVEGSIEHEAMIAGHMKARFDPDQLSDYVRERDILRKRRSEERDLLNREIFASPHLRRKENAPVTSLDEVVYMARAMVAKYRTPSIALVGAENEDAIAAAKQANEEGRYPIAKFLLVGDYYEVNKLAWEYDISVDSDNYTIVDSKNPVERATELLDSGEADLIMKGRVKTEEIMRGTLKYLKNSGRLKEGRIYSHVGVFQIPTYHKLLMVTDAALIPKPDNEMRKKILENALRVCGYLNISKPRVAIISAVETMNPSVESSMLAGELAKEYKGRGDCIVEGPLSLDIAMDPHSAREKRYKGEICGNADILLMPDIEAGNVVYKSLTVSSGAYLAGAIVGAGIPIVLTSRGDSARSKLASICLASIIAMKQGDIAISRNDSS